MIATGMSTACAYPHDTEHAFALASRLGFDGIEVMVTRDRRTQNAETLNSLSERYGLPVLSIHAPVLVFTQLVWGLDPIVKLERSAELATAVGAPTVVVHPPFRWQARYAAQFTEAVREIGNLSGVDLAVENMFPLNVAGRRREVYAPGWDPVTIDCDSATLDFSHAALAGQNSSEMARRLGERLRHLHLCDGSKSVYEGGVFDEHLPPGDGAQPVAEVLAYLAAQDWHGSVIAEISSHGRTDAEREERLTRTLRFARAALGVGTHRAVSRSALDMVG